MPAQASVPLVTSMSEVTANIERFQRALLEGSELHGLLSTFQAWYAVRDEAGQWLYGPAKFIVVAGMTAQNYRELGSQVEIRTAEKLLSRWFGHPPTVAEDSHLEVLTELLSRYGRVLSDNARVMVPKTPRTQPEGAGKPTGRNVVDALLVLYRSLDTADQVEFRRRMSAE